ncbi:S41 family peptidase [Flavihumibacter sp. ZG627]|uniref:S41 family peptidase n=1 Tax=Flavihumibacter sp. ZG627 TaxID=1463156 RepID=UPI00057C5C67|nr:S41 family peptidase [Flavihumibacter sp. ZG627]KIC92311.1 hypothetical protein HY58_01875 [Flavihumibacter sp. ZG627]
MKMALHTYWNSLSIIMLAFLLSANISCTKQFDLEQPPVDSGYVFEEAWKRIDTRYSLFGTKNIDWQLIHDAYKSRIRSGLTENELFELIAEMLMELKDGHVALSKSSRTSAYDQFYTSFSTNFNWQNILLKYLGNQIDNIGPFIFKAGDGVSYIRYASFNDDFTEEQLDNLMDKISSQRGIILDLRHNMGGNLNNAARLFSRFADTTTLVKYTQEKSGSGHNDLGKPIPYHVEKKGFPYTGKIIILTNRRCFSACNEFILYMSELPRVKLLGDRTGGGSGLPEEFILANGWILRYPSSHSLSVRKEYVEDGIEPDIVAEISSVDEYNGRDPILERAIAEMQ